MAVRSINAASGTAGLRPSNFESVDIVQDLVDHRMKYLGDDGIVHSICTDDLDGGPPLSLTGNTTLAAATHAGKKLIFNNAAGGTITLPAATGSGNTYYLFIGTTLTSGSFVVQVANSTDYMRGEAYTFSGAAASTFGTANTGTVATESDTLTFNRTTTGLGTQGDFIELIDILPHVWAIEADYASSGTAATPFTAAV